MLLISIIRNDEDVFIMGVKASIEIGRTEEDSHAIPCLCRGESMRNIAWFRVYIGHLGRLISSLGLRTKWSKRWGDLGVCLSGLHSRPVFS